MRDLERPAQAAGRSSRFSPRPPLGSLTKEMGLILRPLNGTGKQKPSGTMGMRRRVLTADFFGASSVASALGIRAGATPRGHRWQATAGDGTDRQPERSIPAGALH